jgi:hypothetical protein
MPKDINLFKNHQLPLARIKKIMKSDEDVRVFFLIIGDDIIINASTFRQSLRNIHCRTHLPGLGLYSLVQKKNASGINNLILEKRRICLHLQHLNFRFFD